MIALFWTCVALIVWAYVGYPLSMYLLARFWPTLHVYARSATTHITVIIPTYNGSEYIYDKLLNTFNTEYPSDCLSVIVTMDGYCYKTVDEIDRFLQVYSGHKSDITVTHIDREGKEAAQLHALKMVSTPIVVFTDVNTEIQPKTFFHIVKHFTDVNIGAVDGITTVKANGNHSNEGLYLRYEGKIRDWESNTCGLLGTGGCLFAARTSFLRQTILVNGKKYPGFVPDMQSDFRTALVMRTHGLRTVFDRDAAAFVADGNEKKEYSRKHRTIVRGINVFMHNLHLLNPLNYGLFSYAFFNHKLLKWLVPFFMIGAYVSSGVAGWHGNSFYTAMFALQSVLYIMSLNEYKNKYGKILSFFVKINIAILHAWLSYAMGERYVKWEATKR